MTTRVWRAEDSNQVTRKVTPVQSAFLDMIEGLKFCEIESLTVLNGDPIKWRRVVEQKRFDIPDKKS